LMRGVRLAVVALSLSLGGCAWISNWYKGGADNTEPPAELVSFSPTLDVRTLWSTQVGVGSDGQLVKLVPAVAEGRVFAADRRGRVVAVDAASGKRLWEADTEAPISAGPGIGEGLVLVGTSEGEILALNQENGAIAWRAPVSSEVLAVPQAAAGIVVVATMDGKVTGLDAATGARRWIHDRSVPLLTLRGASTPLLTRSQVISGFASGKLAALDLQDGRLQWEATVAVPRGRSEVERLADISADPVLVGGVVFVVSFQGRIAAVAADSGRIGWARDFSSYTGLAADWDQVYVVDDQSQVWALDTRNGASVWRQDKLRARGVTAPAVSGPAVVVGDFEGYLHWLGRDDGEFMARVRVDDNGVVMPPVVAEDVIYVLGKGGSLKALKIERK